MEDLFGCLDRDLFVLGKRLRAELDGDIGLLALRGLENVLEWISAMSIKFDFQAENVGGSIGIYRDLLNRVEREPGLKVPGSHSSPCAAAEGRVGPGGTMCLPAKRDRGVQTRGTTRVDIAIGGDPVRLAKAGVQASCEPRESPTIVRKRRRRNRRRGARTSASASSPSSDEESQGVPKETGRGGDSPVAGTIVCEVSQRTRG